MKTVPSIKTSEPEILLYKNRNPLIPILKLEDKINGKPATPNVYLELGYLYVLQRDFQNAFRIFVIFMAVLTILMLVGQTISVFDYELTVRLGLQESKEQVGDFGVQVNRAIGVGDTVVYIPLLIASFVGLLLRKRWSLLTTAAALGVSAYWSVTVMFIYVFLPGTQGYNYVPALEIWCFVAAYAAFGVIGLFYLLTRGEELLI